MLEAKVLVVTDSQIFFDMICAEVKRCRAKLELARARDFEGLERALQSGSWDLVITDSARQGSDVCGLVRSVKDRCPDLSLLVVTDSISTEAAVDIMRAGASDLILTTSLVKLVPAIDRELAGNKSRMKEAKAAVDQAKSRFLANMSHEIRTPLSVILGFSELALNPQQSEAQKQHALTRIRKNAEVLAELVNDIIDLSKIEAGKFDTDAVDFNLHEMLQEVLATMLPKAKEKNLGLRKIAPVDLPMLAVSDPTRIRQVLMNLIRNSIKFTNQGEVILEVSWSKSPSGTVSLHFSVTDTGIGIEKELATQLFKDVSQADTSRSRKHGGTGLGLVLSSKLAELLGGALCLEATQPGQGSRFRFDLPVTVPCAGVPRNHDGAIEAKSASPLMGLKVLVIDDSVDNRELTRRYLESQGAKVELAADGYQGVMVALQDPDSISVVLLDIQMPGMDGFATFQTLKEKSFVRPVIALTASALKDERERALALGFFDYMNKPFDRVTLSKRLREAARVEGKSSIRPPAVG